MEIELTGKSFVEGELVEGEFEFEFEAECSNVLLNLAFESGEFTEGLITEVRKGEMKIKPSPQNGDKQRNGAGDCQLWIRNDCIQKKNDHPQSEHLKDENQFVRLSDIVKLLAQIGLEDVQLEAQQSRLIFGSVFKHEGRLVRCNCWKIIGVSISGNIQIDIS